MNIKTLFTQNKKQFFFYILGILIITPSNIMVTFALANAFNIFEVTSVSEIVELIMVSIALGFTPILLQVISRFLRIGFMRDVLVQVRMLSFKKLLSKTPSEFKETSMESYQSELVSDVNLFENDFFLSILQIIYAFGNFIIGIIILAYISPLIAVSTTVAALLLFVLTKIFEKPTLQRKKEVVKENGLFHQSLGNILHGLETIKLYQVVDKFKTTFYNDISKLEQSKKASFQVTLLQKNIMAWLSGTFQIFTVVYAAYLFSQQRIILSSLVVVFNLIGQLIWGMNNGFSMINRYKTSVEIFNSITKYIVSPSLEQKFELKNEIIINNLSFNYNDKKILSNVSLNIKNKDKVLIFGPSGTGKTTLVNLITQNLEDYSGEILYDGVSLKDIDPRSFNDSVGYVRQEHFIFDESIKSNIILNKPYDSKKFVEVLRQAELFEWINDLELKEDHVLINNGSNISGGQRQRINIARELYQNKKMIIFDEPSASLDDLTSSNIYKTIKDLDKTVIVISHRHLEFLQNSFDQVIDLSIAGGVTNV